MTAALSFAVTGFVANQGQADPTVRYHGAAPRAGFYATDQGMTVAFGTAAATEVLMLRFVGGANAHPRITPSAPLGGTVNVLRKPAPSTRLTRFDVLTYESVWPGVDVRFHVQGGILEYEFVVAPGADPGPIHLAWQGAEARTVQSDRALRLMTASGPLIDRAPISFQGDEQVATRYVLGRGDQFRFDVGQYDRTHALVISSGLLYWTFLGGTEDDVGNGVTVDAAGAAYLTGYTYSPDFPSADRRKGAAGYDRTYNQNGDAFVVKLNPVGQTLAYWTFLGGTDHDIGSGIAVDGTGAAYVTGYTVSSDFPSADRPKAPPGYDQTYNGNEDAFVVKLDPLGQTLAYWTFLGGTGSDFGNSIAVDASGAAYVTGQTDSPDFPSADRPKVAAGYDQTHNGSADAFVVRLDPLGQTVAYWTFLGGTSIDFGTGIAIDAAGAAYVTGGAFSSVFPSADQPTVAAGYDQTHNGGRSDVFIVKLDPFGQTLAYWTFLGGAAFDAGYGITVDAAGAAYVTGSTRSSDFPSTNRPIAAAGYDQSYNGNGDAFVVKLDLLGQTLAYWTFLGGTISDAGSGIAIDAAGAAYVTGYTGSPDFPSTDRPTIAAGYDQTYNGSTDADAFVVKLDPLGQTLAYWTFLGGTATDIAYGIAVDGAGAAYVTGYTYSPDFPSADRPKTAAGYDQTYNQNAYNQTADAFVVKLDIVGLPAMLVLTPPTATNPVRTRHTVTATVTDVARRPVPETTVRLTVVGAHVLSGSCTTNRNGQCSFSYVGMQVGTDAIEAYTDTNTNAVQDLGEPTGAASKVWTRPTRGCRGDEDRDNDDVKDTGRTHTRHSAWKSRLSDSDGTKDRHDDSDRRCRGRRPRRGR